MIELFNVCEAATQSLTAEVKRVLAFAAEVRQVMTGGTDGR